jgi:hypothetical protein
MAGKKEQEYTFAERLQTLRERRHQLSVYYDLISYVDETLAATDTRPSKKVLQAAECDVPVVPQGVIEGVRADLMEKATEIEDQIIKMLEE